MGDFAHVAWAQPPTARERLLDVSFGTVGASTVRMHMLYILLIGIVARRAA